MDTKTLITIDFDGCISPIDHSKDFTKEPGFKFMRLAGLHCAVSDEVIEFLKTVNTSQNTVPLWASSWEENLNNIHEDSENEIPFIPWLPVNSSKKLSIVNHVTENGYRKVVIIEDSTSVTTRLRKLLNNWNLNHPSETVEYLIIKPKLTEGLTKRHIEDIYKFVGISVSGFAN